MIQTRTATAFENRQHAAYLLAERLLKYRSTDAVLVAIPRGGVITGYYLSQLLGIDLEVLPCKRLRNPADVSQSIGSVTANEVILHEGDHDIPQNYVYHQVKMLQRALEREQAQYYPASRPASLAGKTVIVVDDFVTTGDSILAVLKSVVRQKPGKIVVATPVIAEDALQNLYNVCDEVIYLRQAMRFESAKRLYKKLDDVSTAEAKQFFIRAGRVPFVLKGN